MTFTSRWASLVVVGLVGPASAAPPDFDALARSSTRLSLPRPSPLGRLLLDRARVSSVDETRGVPTFMWVARDPHAVDLRAAGLTPEEAARRALFTWAELYRVKGSELAEASLVRLHDRGEGAVIAGFERRVGGVPVFRDRLNVILDRRLQVIALSGALSPMAPGAGRWRLSPHTAVEVALVELSPGTSASLRSLGRDESGAELLGGEALLRPARVRKVFYGTDRELVPAFHVELEVGQGTGSDFFAYVISAHDGALLYRQNLTAADSFSYRVWADPTSAFPADGPQGLAGSPHPTATPSGFNPAYVAPSLVTLQNGPLSTMDPWLPAGATETTGNNVEAYADLAAPDGFGTGDLRASATAAGVFDRVFDPTLEPNASTAQQQAAITQLFYTVNFLHDWFYDSGFDEAAGNGQADNLGRGGLASDSLKAEAQDVGGFNNANMSTPSDGSRPRMQMYLWRPAASATVNATPPGATWNAGVAAFGPTSFSLTGTAVLAAPANGCTTLTNAAAVAGNVAVLDRGTCSFAIKVAAAQAAGAIGALIVNNTAGSAPAMAGTDPSITIPSLSLSQADGNALKAELANGPVAVSLARPFVPMRDGTIDNTIVAHEWGHYLSNRLVADSSGLTNQQGRGMGEGWGDFIALLLMVREDDAQQAANANFQGTYAVSGYSMSGPAFPDAYYFGIRRYPYSVDFTKNALTFRHIADGQALPTGLPLSPGPSANSEVHNTGEVWASTLWECYVSLLRASPRLTFTQARDRMRRYLVEGLKATPPAPTFVEARDALLAAAAARDAADFLLFAQAFARRGLGMLAVAPPRTSATNTPVVEDFNLGNELVFLRATLDDEVFYCDRDGTLDSGERGRLRVTLKNTGLGALSATTGTISTSTPGVTITGGALSFPSSQPFGTVTAEATVALAGAAAVTPITFQLTFDDPQLTNAGPRTATLVLRANADEVASSSAADDAETSLVAWTSAHDAALAGGFDWRRFEESAVSHLYLGTDPGRTADTYFTSPPLQVGTGTFGFTFNHRWAFESSGTTNYDGAVLELSANGGQSWTDLGASVTPGYNGTLTTVGPSTNPLAGRPAFVARSASYPAMIPAAVSLGTAYAGQTVQVRFRIGSDYNAADVGWEVDDLAFTGLTNTPFPSLVADRGQCLNRPPVADAGPDFAADERGPVTLDSSRSSDVDLNALTARWTQVSGPAVTLSGNTFTAPEVAVDTPLTFSLVVNDGTVDSAPDEVTVTIRQVNRAPVADAGVPQAVDERSLVTLEGSAVDPDADALALRWRQVSGPMAVLSSLSAARPSFTAPEVLADGALEFELIANDGQVDGAPSRVTISVRQVNQPPSVTAIGPGMAAERQPVTLTAVGVDRDGDRLTYAWTQVAGPPVALSDASAASPGLTAPAVDADTILTFQVLASDGQADSAPASLSLTVLDDNLPPVADPGPPQQVAANAHVQLDGSKSSDPEGTALRFSWAQVEGQHVELAGASTAAPSFTAPAVASDVVLSFRLTVRDAPGLTSSGTVKVTVMGTKAQGCGCTSGAGTGVGPWAALLLALGLLRRRVA
ncbi:MAG: myxosortase-dependent M36 family metallopeptidase [Myxococcales bacterium]|nr:myxosortase-dependent M36 family metallopeptidase [Myxococcales bacterium]